MQIALNQVKLIENRDKFRVGEWIMKCFEHLTHSMMMHASDKGSVRLRNCSESFSKDEDLLTMSDGIDEPYDN